MKYEFGSFDAHQIRINSGVLKSDECKYNSTLEHEIAHNYLTYLSTLGFLQVIVKAYSGTHTELYKYLFKRGDRIQEIIALFFEYCAYPEVEVKKKLSQKLSGISVNSKEIIFEFLKNIDEGSDKGKFKALMLSIGVASLSANFEQMNLSDFFYNNKKASKFLETFFRENKINPKDKFNRIVKYCKEQIDEKVPLEEISDKIIKKYMDENIEFIYQSPKNLLKVIDDNILIDARRENFDYLLSIIVRSAKIQRDEIIEKGIYQIPILSSLDVRYDELNKSEKKKLLKNIKDTDLIPFLLLKEYSMFKSSKNIDVIVPVPIAATNKFSFKLFNSTLDSFLSQDEMNIITRIPRAICFKEFLNYYSEILYKNENQKKINFFILGIETQIKEIIEELVKEYGEQSLKYFYKDIEQNAYLISVYEAKNVNIILYSEYSIIREWEIENLSDKKPDEKLNYLISIYINLLSRTDVFDRI